MRLFVVHDESGNIEQMVMCPEGAPITIPSLSPGYSYSECEPPEGLSEDTAPEARLQFMRQYRFDVAKRHMVQKQ